MKAAPSISAQATCLWSLSGGARPNNSSRSAWASWPAAIGRWIPGGVCHYGWAAHRQRSRIIQIRLSGGRRRGGQSSYFQKELRELLGDGGVFCSSQGGDYMALVNQLLFGFHSLDEYDELIKLLIQLRSPKLSKDFRPNVLYGIMNSSLQALSDEDLRPLTETVENMDQMRTQLAELKRNQRAAAKIQSEYNKYNRALLYNKAVNWQEARAGLRRRERAIRENERLQQAEQEEFQALGGIKISRLDQEQTALAAKELELRDDDAFRLEERYQAQLRRRDELGATIAA